MYKESTGLKGLFTKYIIDCKIAGSEKSYTPKSAKSHSVSGMFYFLFF